MPSFKNASIGGFCSILLPALVSVLIRGKLGEMAADAKVFPRISTPDLSTPAKHQAGDCPTTCSIRVSPDTPPLTESGVEAECYQGWPRMLVSPWWPLALSWPWRYKLVSHGLIHESLRLLIALTFSIVRPLGEVEHLSTAAQEHLSRTCVVDPYHLGCSHFLLGFSDRIADWSLLFWTLTALFLVEKSESNSAHHGIRLEIEEAVQLVRISLVVCLFMLGFVTNSFPIGTSRLLQQHVWSFMDTMRRSTTRYKAPITGLPTSTTRVRI